MGHLFCENRAVFAVGLVCIPTCVLQHILLTLDIMPGQLNFSLQRLGPFAQIVAWVALAIEYTPYYDPSTAAIGYILVYVAHGFHIIYTIQLLRICAPDFSAPDQAEVPQGTWWPGQWRLPKAFKHAVWLVAPPRHLEPSQNDLVGEMRKASEGGTQSIGQPGRLTFDAVEAKRRDVHRALGKQGESPAWFNVRTGLLGLLVAWIYLVIGFTIEVANAHTSTPSFLSAGGMPNNLRDPRYRPPKALLANSMIDTTSAPPLAQAKAASVEWPALFEPRLLCGHASAPKLLALSHHGRGLIIEGPHSTPVALHGGDLAGRCGWCEPHAVRAAVMFPQEKSVVIMAHTGHEKDSWLPSGEARTRAVASSAAFAAEGKELLLTSQDDGCCMVRETVDNAVEGGMLKLMAAPVVGTGGYFLLAHHILLYLVMGGVVYVDANKHAQREGVEVYNPVVLNGVWEDTQKWGIQRWRARNSEGIPSAVSGWGVG
eukprot:g28274.t1